jgi:hypothetical protein
MRESCMYGSERGARGNSCPYRTRRTFITLLGGAADVAARGAGAAAAPTKHAHQMFDRGPH